MDLAQLDLNPRIVAAAGRAKLSSVRDVLHFSAPDLQRLTGLSGPDVQHLLRTAASHLRGHAVVTGAVYVCTEDAFPHRRLQQLVAQQQRLRQDVPGAVLGAVRFGDQIFVEHAADVDALLDCVQRKVPMLLARGMARLLVIDSVAAPFRCEVADPAAAPRARRLQQLGQALRRLSWAFRTPVLCVNQVTDAVEERDPEARLQGPGLGHVCPALGAAWSSELLVRLMADRRRPGEGPARSPPGRTLHVVSAPHLPPSSCSYTVNAEGVRGVPGTESH